MRKTNDETELHSGAEREADREEDRIFRPRVSLARSPVPVEGGSNSVDYPSPRIDLNSAAIQIPAKEVVGAPMRDRQGRFVRRTAEEILSREDPHAPPVSIEGGREGRFEKIAKVLLTRIDRGIVASGDPDTDGTMYTVQSNPSPVTSPSCLGSDGPPGDRTERADVEPAALPKGKLGPKNRGKGKARPRLQTPFKVGNSGDHHKSSVDSPVPVSDAELDTQTSRMWQDRRKRMRPSGSGSQSLSSGDEAGPSTGSAGSSQASGIEKFKPKARGRPPTVGKYVGLGKARTDLKKAREEFRLQHEQDAEVEIANMAIRMRPTVENRLYDLPDSEPESQLASDLITQIMDSVAITKVVAKKSLNLKGTYQRKLNQAAEAISDAAAVLIRRTASDENKRLQAANSRLQAQMVELRQELDEIKAKLRQVDTVTSKQIEEKADQTHKQPALTSEGDVRRLIEEVCRSNSEHFSNMLNARLEGIEDRLLPAPRLRPPLAVDRKAARAVTAAGRMTGDSTPTSVQSPKLLTGNLPAGQTADKDNAVRKDGKHKKKQPKRSLAAQEAAASRQRLPSLEAPGPSTERQSQAVSNEKGNLNPTKESWSSKNKKAKRKEKKTTGPTSQAAPKKKAQKLRLPQSTAVVLTLLQPKADTSERESYAAVIGEAKKQVDLDALGISGVRVRRTATNARIFEIPGRESGEKADALANKLREVMDPALVRISRPTKCAEMRISGLDDSVVSPEVVEAVAREGGCAVEDIKAGEVALGPSGLGTVWLRCPVAAAKKVAQAGRLRVGWVSAQVNLLDTRPTRCFRCLEVGHVRTACKSEVDRSRLCYRCSGSGHIARDCNATAHCALCAEAGLPAGHRVGSTSCNPPKRKKTAVDRAKTPLQPSRPQRPEPGVEEDQMATD